MKVARRLHALGPAAALSALLASTAPALAQTPAVAPAAASSPAAGAMSIAQVIEHLGARGYRDFREVERKGDKLFEVKTHDAQGVRLELVVDARSGEVLKSELDD